MVGETLKTLLMIAWLLPLLGFAVGILGGYWGTRQSKAAALVSVGCIAVGFLCSASALIYWGEHTDWEALAAQEHHDGEHGDDAHHDGESHDESAPHDHSEGDGEHSEDAEVNASSDGSSSLDSLQDYQLTSAAAQEDHPEEHSESLGYYTGTIYTLAVSAIWNCPLTTTSTA